MNSRASSGHIFAASCEELNLTFSSAEANAKADSKKDFYKMTLVQTAVYLESTILWLIVAGIGCLLFYN